MMGIEENIFFSFVFFNFLFQIIFCLFIWSRVVSASILKLGKTISKIKDYF